MPVFIKGPGIAKGSIFPGIGSMADFAPTILELAAGGNDPTAVPDDMYGRLIPQGLGGAMDRRVPYRGPRRPIAPPR